MGAAASRWGAVGMLEAIGAGRPSALVAIPGGFAVAYTVRDAVAGSLSTPRVSLVTPHVNTTLDVAVASGGVRDVRLAWSDRHGLLATMVLLTTTDANIGLGVGAFLAPRAVSFGPIETIAPTGNITPGFGRDEVALVVWSAPPDTTDPVVATGETRAVVQTSARTG